MAALWRGNLGSTCYFSAISICWKTSCLENYMQGHFKEGQIDNVHASTTVVADWILQRVQGQNQDWCTALDL